MLANVAAAAASSDSDEPNPLLAYGPKSAFCSILVTGDRGLAGAFNTNLIKAATVSSPNTAARK